MEPSLIIMLDIATILQNVVFPSACITVEWVCSRFWFDFSIHGGVGMIMGWGLKGEWWEGSGVAVVGFDIYIIPEK